MKDGQNETPAVTQRIDVGSFPHPNGINFALPESIRNHPMVWEKWFYTLPTAVWGSLCNALGRDRFDTDYLELEIAASQYAESTLGCVGFHKGLPFSDFYLRPLHPLDLFDPTVAKYLEECRIAGEKVPTSSGQITEKLEALKMPQIAYLGWLLTNRAFLVELQQLRSQFPSAFDQKQNPPVPALFSEHVNPHELHQLLKSTNDSTCQAVRNFCQRWRLNRMVGPATYSPLSVQFPVALPARSVIDAQRSGSLLFIPDIAPVPNRDLLEQLVQEVVQQTIQHETHLAEWFKLVHGGKLGRKTLNGFAKIYALQHFIRVLYSRHGERLHRQQTKIYEVIGAYVGLKSEQMLRTMQRIRLRLGKDWLTPEQLLVLHR